MTLNPPKAFVDLDNARQDDQREVMEQIIAEGTCPFCLENLQKHHPQPLLKKGEYWVLTENRWPYEHTKHHILAISTKHVETLSELDPAAGAELFKLFAEIEREYNVPGGGLALRFGDTDYSAGTVNHLHAHFIEPDITAPEYQPVRFKIGKSPKKK